MIDLADTLKSINDFLNSNPEEIIQIKEGYLTKEQLEEGREIVRKNPEIMDNYKFFEKYDKGCNECISRIICCEIFNVVCAEDLYYCDKTPMFIPERIFDKVKGFENYPREFREGYFEEED